MSNDNFSKVILVQKVVFFSILHGNKLTFCVFFVWFFVFFGQNDFFPCNTPLRANASSWMQLILKLSQRTCRNRYTTIS
jgi:hypothetical protein